MNAISWCVKKIRGFFFENSQIAPETESRNSEDHQFWNQEMWGSTVYCFYLLCTVSIKGIDEKINILLDKLYMYCFY